MRDKGEDVAAPDSDSKRRKGGEAYSSPMKRGSTQTPGDPKYGGNVPNVDLSGSAEDYSRPQKLGGDIGEVGGTGVSGKTQVPQFTGDGEFEEARDANGSEQKLYANQKKGGAVGRP